MTRTYGVFVWRSDGRYRAADASATYAREHDAQRKADELTRFTDAPGGYVVRRIHEARQGQDT